MTIIRKVFNHPIFLVFGAIGTLIGIWQFVVEPIKQRKAFDETAQIVFDRNSSEFMSSTNYLLTVLPSNVISTRDNRHWDSFTKNWRKHSQIMDKFYQPLSDGLIDGSLRPGGLADQVCENVGAILKSHHEMISYIETIEGVGISMTGESAPELSVFGPVIIVPSMPNLKTIFTATCDGRLSNLADTKQEVSEKEVLTRELAAVRDDIKHAEGLTDFDFDAALEEEYRRYVDTYAGYLISKGMYAPDARAEGEVALREMLTSKGQSNWLVPGMNDIELRIKKLQSDRRRDYSSVIEILRDLEKELLKKIEKT